MPSSFLAIKNFDKYLEVLIAGALSNGKRDNIRHLTEEDDDNPDIEINEELMPYLSDAELFDFDEFAK